MDPGLWSGEHPSPGERAADRARDAAGSWPFVAIVVVLVGVEVVAAIGAGWTHAAVLAVLLAGLALVELSEVLMSARRAARTASERARHDLQSARRAAAAIDEIRDDVVQLRGELAGLAARLKTSTLHPANRDHG